MFGQKIWEADMLVHDAGVCSVCLGPAEFGAADTVAIPETHFPGLALDGDPSRLVLWHRQCAPQWVLDEYDAPL